jgi:uracil-DNA glycosylase family 4
VALGRPPRLETARAKYPKPATCRPCPLFDRGRGYVPADGPDTADILFVGETPWVDEIIRGIPFAGAAGAMVHRLLRRNFMTREQFRWDNIIRCAPPHMEFAGTSYEHAAAHHCRQYLGETLAEGHTVIVPLGGSALKHVLELHGGKIKVEDFHGTVSRHESGALVVPTFHPSHIQRGATNMTGTWSWDLQRALEVAKQGWVQEDIECVIDPPLDWFRAWVTDYLAAATQSPMDYWCAVDIETLEKAGRDEDALGPMNPEMAADRAAMDRSYTITRLNLACHPDQGVTVPWVEPYISEAKRALASRGVKLLWNEDYDLPRLHAQDAMPDGPCWDLMEAWHLIQSDVPRSLGFVSPFHSGFGPWKHLSESEPERYAAIDGPQTLRNGYGIIPTLHDLGLWDVFQRHWYQLKRQVLQPAHIVGIQVDRPALNTFIDEMSEHCKRLLDELQDYVPDEVLPLANERKTKPPDDIVYTKATTEKVRGGKKKHAPDELKMELYQRAAVVEKLVLREVLVCKTCGSLDVARRHKCQASLFADGPVAAPELSLETATVTRWFWKEPFNPDSAKQILAYIKATGSKPGRAKKTGADTGDRETLQGLFRVTKDPFYQAVLVYRSVQKVRGTYGLGIRKRLDADDRIHPVPTFKPSTQRQSYQSPNIQNVISDKGGEASLAAGFRKCIVAAPGCRLLEVDYRGIEAVQVGWFSRDPDYIRLAKLGVHAALASHVLERPYDPAWSDSDLVDYFYEIKEREPLIYTQTKTVVHGVSYGRTPHGMHRDYPEMFPTLKDANRIFDIFYAMAPAIPRWQQDIRQHVDKHGYLGGPGEPPFGHPYNYRHYYYGVFTYSRLSPAQAQRLRAKYGRLKRPAPLVEVNGIDYKQVNGDDAKRLVAFPPQSTASANLKDAELILFGDPDSALYLGNAYYGQTCLRAPIHDSLLLEYPVEEEERVLLNVATAMCRPILQQPLPSAWGMGEHLTIGVEAKASAVGGNWMAMETIDLPVVSTPSLAADRTYFPIQDGLKEQGTDEWEEWMDLGRAMGHLPLRAASAPVS